METDQQRLSGGSKPLPRNGGGVGVQIIPLPTTSTAGSPVVLSTPTSFIPATTPAVPTGGKAAADILPTTDSLTRSQAVTAAGPQQPIVTEQADGGERHVLDISAAIALQVIVVVLILAGIGLLFWLRRRGTLRLRRRSKSQERPNSELGSEKPYWGYRATILGSLLDKLRGDKGKTQDARFSMVYYEDPKPSMKDLEAGTSTMASPAELPAEPILLEMGHGDEKRRRSTLRKSMASRASLAVKGHPIIPHPLRTHPVVSRHTLAAAPPPSPTPPSDEDWVRLPEAPKPIVARHSMHSQSPQLRIPTPEFHKDGKLATPTLAEIRERLTGTDSDPAQDLGLLVPPATTAESTRWSTTTYSSTFTASTAHSSMVFVSSLRPPPLPQSLSPAQSPEPVPRVPDEHRSSPGDGLRAIEEEVFQLQKP